MSTRSPRPPPSPRPTARYLEEPYATNKAGKVQLCQAFDALKLRYVPSYGNFVLVHVGDAPASTWNCSSAA